MNLLVVLSVLLATTLAVPPRNKWINSKNDLDTPIPIFSLQPRILGGINATQGMFPYMVPLWVHLISSQGIEFGNFCGAILISNNFLLTAAHCINGEPVGAKVDLGSFDISKDFEPGRIEIEIPKENLIVHEEYNSALFLHDIGLIRLPQKVAFTRDIQPVKLPRRSQVNLDQDISVVTGWGALGQNAQSSTVLRYAQLSIRPNDFCAGFYGAYYHPSNICIDGSRQSPCSGDSGGAAVIMEGEQRSFTLVGVSSYVSPYGCQKGYPVAYTRVTSYLEWIHKHTAIPISD